MQIVGVRELKERASEILRRVREDGDAYEVSYHGRVIARLIPVTQPDSQDDLTDFLRSWEQLAADIGAHWPKGVSAVDAVREGRREL